MFGNTFSFKITSTNGVPSGIAEVKEENVLAGALKAVTSKFSDDTHVTGLGRTVGELGQAYVVAQGTRMALGGAFALNPFSKQ